MPLFVFVLSMAFISASHAVTIVSSINPLTLLAEEITQNTGDTVHNIVPANQSSHDYHLRPNDRTTLSNADLRLWVGPSHETFLADFLANKQRLNKPTISAQNLPCISLLPTRGSHHHGSSDEHLWLNPDNAYCLMQTLATQLSVLNPQHAATYQKNLHTFFVELEKFKTQTAARKNSTYLAHHDAYQYLEAPLNLTFAGHFLNHPEDTVSAGKLWALAQLLEKKSIRCVLIDVHSNPKILQRLQEKLHFQIIVIDEMLNDGKLAYWPQMWGVAEKLKGC